MPSGATLPVRHKQLLTLALMMAMMIQILDTTVANVALPHMTTSLGASLDTIAWVLTSYIVASAVAMPLTGWLADRFGSRKLMLASVFFFIVASMLCGIATDLGEMVIFRMMQGVAAAFIGPLTQSCMLDINPPEEQARAMSIWSTGAVLGPIIGPVIGGWLTDSYSWRWVFYINLPLGVIALALLYALMPSRATKRRGFDMFGFAAIAVGIAGLQLMLDRGEQLDWFDSMETWVLAGVAICGFWVFIVHLCTGRNTIITARIFANRNFAGSLFLIFLVGMILFSTMALLPELLQGILGYPVFNSGMMLSPRGIGIIMTMALAGKLTELIDPRIVLATGLAISAYALHMMTQWSIGMDWWPVVISGFVQGLGIGFVFVSLNIIAFATLPDELRTEGASLLNLFRSLGASIGISLGVFNLSRALQTSHADLAQNITPSVLPNIRLETLGQFGQYSETMLALVDKEVTRQALMVAYIDVFWLMMVISVAALPTVFILKRAPVGKRRAKPAVAAPESAAPSR